MKFYEFIKDAKIDKKRVVIYGKGALGLKIKIGLEKRKANLLGYIDSESSDEEKSILKDSNVDYVIICAYEKKTKNQIDGILYKDYGIPQSKHMHVLDDEDVFFILQDMINRYDFFRTIVSRQVSRCSEKVIDRGHLKSLAMHYLFKEILGNFEYPEWHDNAGGEVLYLNLAKCGCSSVHFSMQDEDIPYDEYVKRSRHIVGNVDELGPKFKFTFVRNPFRRIVSCYCDKIEGQDDGRFATKSKYMLGIFEKDNGFEDFINLICLIPDEFSERHFLSQTALLYEEDRCVVDYVGRVEYFEKDYEPLIEKYRLKPIGKYNTKTTDDWKDYYTTELVEKVYQRYKRDVEKLGYHKEYVELLQYCRERGK